jgi:hypothetical protein
MADEHLLLDVHGHRSASQRREQAAAIRIAQLEEAVQHLRMSVDYMRAVLVWSMQKRSESVLEVPEAEMRERLGVEIETAYTDDKKSLIFTIKTEEKSDAEVR